MYSFSAVVVVLLATSYALAEEHLVPKHGLESRHSVSKRDLSETDMEMILKALMSKMEHKGTSDGQLMHKDVDREHYLHGAEAGDKLHHAAMKEEYAHASKGHPVDYAYIAEESDKSGYGMEKSVGIGEKDLAALMMKMKELGIGKDVEELHKKEVYLGSPEEKFLPEKDYYAKGPLPTGKFEKGFEAVMGDQFSDKDVSLAESLYHMKIAGDIETYPHIKMEPLYDMKMADEKLKLEKSGSEESYLKKIDEISKTILKEEHLKDGEAFLKKIAEEKSPFYDPKTVNPESVLKSEEKALEAWKANHKELFLAEGGPLFDDKLMKEGIHHADEGIALGISDELIKKLKSLGLDKEHDELLHLLSKEMHKEAGITEGSIAFEKAKEQAHKDAHIHLSEEEMKKHIEEALAFEGKEKLHGSELLFEKGLSAEKVHGINTKIGVGVDKSLHGFMGEESFKAKEAHALDEAHKFEMDKTKLIGKIPFMEGEMKHGVGHEMSDGFSAEAGKAFKVHEEEIMKKGKGFATDGMLHKAHEEELMKKGLAQGTDVMFHKAQEEELFKKGLGHGTDAMLHKAHEEEMLKKGIGHGTDAMLHKAHEEEMLKKGIGHGTEPFLHKVFEEEMLKKEKAHGSDAFLYKAHEDDLLKKEKAYETDAFLHKSFEEGLLKNDKAYAPDAFLHKAREEELLKKGKAYGIDSGIHKVHEDELIKKEIAYGVDPAIHKTHEDELFKKEIAYGTGGMFHKDKEIAAAAGDHMHEEKSHKSFHDLKTKFFELLRRVLRTRKCHLVTMGPRELLGIVNCVSRSKDPLLCEKFAMCEKKKPPRVIAALEKCQKETVPEQVKKCTTYAPLFPSTEIPLRIFQCVAINVRELIPEEQKMMIEFEECAREVKTESCARTRFFPF